MNCSILHRILTNNSASSTDIESNQKTNFIAFGDSSGYLEIIDLQNLTKISDSLTQSKEDSYIHKKKATFQVLAFHKKIINRIQWNPVFEKIVTVDEGNSLVVWNKAENDLFTSQMVNNRGISNIVDVKWSKNGKNIVFLYEDGHLYSGTVEGKNTWYNNLGEETDFVEYSPKGDKILVSKKKEKIIVLSSNGKQVGEINLSENIKNLEIASIKWWGIMGDVNEEGGSGIFNNKHLMIAFKNGIVILIDDETDENPVVIKTELKKITKVQWDVDGLCIAILGEIVDDEIIKEEEDEEKEKEKESISEDNKENISNNESIKNDDNNSDINSSKNEINTKVNNINNNNIKKNVFSKINSNSFKSILLFYNVKGELLKKFICPCHVNSFSWGKSSTICLAADKYIYIALAKYKYKWTYFNDTIVFSYPISEQKYNVIFLNTLNNTKQCKLVYNLVDIISSDYYCVIIQE